MQDVWACYDRGKRGVQLEFLCGCGGSWVLSQRLLHARLKRGGGGWKAAAAVGIETRFKG